MNKFTCIIAILLFPIYSSAQLYYPPTTGNNWDTTSAADLGYCTDSVDALYDFLEQNKTKAFILLKDGKIVLEKYFGNFTVDSNWYWASAGKTLTAALVGVAQQNNVLSISDKTSAYLGNGWTSCTPAQEDKITIRHQLTMTTGLDDGVANPGCTQPSCLQYIADAGTRWSYHNAPYTLLDTLLEVASGKKLNQLVTTWMKNPTGMNGLYLKVDENTVYFSTARSMARFGLLLLSKGMWNGTAVLSDTNYYNSMVNTSQNLNLAYGYLTWLNGKATHMIPQTQVVFQGTLNADAPNDMFAALGRDAQLLNVVPSQNMVWVRMGEAPPGSSGLVAPPFNNEIWQRLNRLKCPQSITEHNTKQLAVYPNPTDDMVQISSAEEMTKLQVYDISGKLLLEERLLASQYKLDLNGLAQGVYTLHVFYKDGQPVIQRLLKQ